jgi:hypothetical protein
MLLETADYWLSLGLAIGAGGRGTAPARADRIPRGRPPPVAPPVTVRPDDLKRLSRIKATRHLMSTPCH